MESHRDSAAQLHDEISSGEQNQISFPALSHLAVGHRGRARIFAQDGGSHLVFSGRSEGVSSMIPLMIPHVPESAVRAAAEVLKTRWIGQGPRVEEFEQKFAREIV